MKYKMTEERWNAIKAFFDKVFEKPGKTPDRGALLSLADEEITHLFTKKRLELINLIQKKKPKNATKLCMLANRKLSAVLRDLEILQGFGIVEMRKEGKVVAPKVVKDILILPLIKIEPKKIGEIKAIA